MPARLWGREAKSSSRAYRFGSRSSSQAPFYGGQIGVDARRLEELTYWSVIQGGPAKPLMARPAISTGKCAGVYQKSSHGRPCMRTSPIGDHALSYHFDALVPLARLRFSQFLSHIYITRDRRSIAIFF